MEGTTKPCVFCAHGERELVWESDVVVAFRDAFEVSPGHTLVVPRRHVATYFEAGALEQAEIWRAVQDIKRALDATLKPDGYNVGFNAGVAAGQTVMHLHVHVIPRYRGDMDDPRGGVRGVIPEKQKYGSKAPANTTASASKTIFDELPAFVAGEEQPFAPTVCRALQIADEADVVAAFVQPSGLSVLRGDLEDALRRGARVRVLTGDYMGATSADALRELLRLSSQHDNLAVSFFEVDTAAGGGFHPKSYIFVKGADGIAYVGSSNLTKTALSRSVEWNLQAVSSRDRDTFQQIRVRFDRLWNDERTKPLSKGLIDAYQLRAPIKEAPEARPTGPTPHPIQALALAALRKTRAEDHKRGLVVLATGLGKTYLSAFDFKAMGGERALFVAHRQEILDQAEETWARLFPGKTTGHLGAGTHDSGADVLLASVQTLSRKRHLSKFSPDHFDYIVIDEFHHASAATYRKILAHFTPRFLLGLTATPDRMDGASLLELCDDNLVFRRDLVHGISQRLLVPFLYYAVKDSIDFEPIPWRSGKFDAERLTSEYATEARAEQALNEYRAKAPDKDRRTIAFCCSRAHADFMAEYFNRQGHPAASVHSGPSSAPRAGSMTKLVNGELEIICAVDVFNEGLDVPNINTVLMLRPTQSPIVFLQQLGRGLRKADNKPHLTVVDFIGNHRSFLQKPQALVYLAGEDLPPVVAVAKIASGELKLPEGCLIDIEIEALDLLAQLTKVKREDALLYEYVSFRDAHGRRPTATELLRCGINFEVIKKNYGGWFEFVSEQGDLEEKEESAVASHGAWLRDVLATGMTASYKMVALRALIDADALFGSMDVEDNARRANALIRARLLLYKEMSEDKERRTFGASFIRNWKNMPLKVWAGGKSTSKKWFALDGDSFVSKLAAADEEEQEVVEEMTEELVEMRLHEHEAKLRRKQPLDATQAPIVMVVSHSNRRPILRFDRSARADIPGGETLVMVDGEEYLFRFVKIAVNVIGDRESGENVLPRLMRSWFGPNAGHPGTQHQVQLVRRGDQWVLEKDAEAAPAVVPMGTIPFYPDLAVACGEFKRDDRLSEVKRRIAVDVEQELSEKRHFVVRANGDSMDGGEKPIGDGDLVLCEWLSAGTEASIEGRAHLLIGHETPETSFAAMKIPIKREGRWLLRSANPAHEDVELPAGARVEPVARVIGPVREYSGLLPWGEYDRDAIAAAFGSSNDPSWQVGHRDIDVGGEPHTILMVKLKKGGDTPIEHRYADRFLSREEFQWESQASTTVASAKGQRIIEQARDGRAIHLFVRESDKRRAMIYCGRVTYERHEGEKPMRVWFALERALPEGLWKVWGR